MAMTLRNFLDEMVAVVAVQWQQIITTATVKSIVKQTLFRV